MRHVHTRSRRIVAAPAAALAAALLLGTPGLARAQYSAPELYGDAIGEDYHVEVSGTLWHPNLFGQISSEQFGLAGSQIDFIDDLGYEQTRFKDLRIVLRPTKKARFRIQHTPVRYQAETTLQRDIVFNGQKFPLAVPLASTFEWDVWRFVYEYDFVYRKKRLPRNTGKSSPFFNTNNSFITFWKYKKPITSGNENTRYERVTFEEIK